LATACSGFRELFEADLFDTAGLNLPIIQEECPEKLPWLIFNRYLVSKTLDRDPTEILQEDPCDDIDYGSQEMERVAQCLRGENVTKPFVQEIVRNGTRIGVTLGGILDDGVLCAAVAQLRFIGEPDPNQVILYGVLASICTGEANIPVALGGVTLAIQRNANIAEVINALAGAACADVQAIITGDYITPTLFVDGAVPTWVLQCGQPTITLYRNHVSRLPQETINKLECQNNPCRAILNFVNRKKVPLSCPIATLDPFIPTATPTPTPIATQSISIQQTPFPYQVDAVFTARKATGVSDIFLMENEPEKTPVIYNVVTSSDDKAFPVVSLYNQIAFLQVNGDDVQLYVKDFNPDTLSINPSLPLPVQSPLGFTGYQPVISALVWDEERLILSLKRDTEDIYLLEDWRNPAPLLLIPTAKYPTITTDNGVSYIAYQETASSEGSVIKFQLLRSVLNRAVVNNQSASIGTIIKGSENCKLPNFGRGSITLFFVCDRNGEDVIYRFQINISQNSPETLMREVWKPSDAGFEGARLDKLDTMIAEDVLSFSMTVNGQPKFYFLEVETAALFENKMLLNLLSEYQLREFWWNLEYPDTRDPEPGNTVENQSGPS
jgi:hypothetical protein